ncbi:MAG TPA: phage tail protein [Sphingomonadaceae bacterium]|nr:phage tail protein [Sphingomonadaceae bacterium]
MATLVLSSVGTLIGGPVGGAIGALIGQSVDARVLAPKGRQGPRLGDLAVQTSSYGSAIPRIFGAMRVAGSVIWATDLKEDRHKQGGGKGRPKQTTYSYSASFAVALSGRPIAGVGRIWADGKLLRGAAGDFKTETGFRLHDGSEAQARDPDIAAAEGIASTPAFRGIAYAMFTDFQLGEYGNRIPSLTFEVIADTVGTSTGAIAASVSEGAIAADAGTPLTGFAAHGDSIRGVLGVLTEAVPTLLFDDGERLRLGARGGDVVELAPGVVPETTRAAAGQVPDAVSIGYYDPAREYQAGLQRASHAGAGEGAGGAGAERRGERIALPAALDAGAAKAMASAKLDHLWRTRARRTVTLPWRDIGVQPGCVVRFANAGEAGRLWVVAGWTFERMAVRLELVPHGGGAAAATLPAVPGRAAAAPDDLHGPTTLRVLDPPPLGDAVEARPRLVVAAAGAERGWRAATLEVSGDGGASWSAAGMTAPAAVMGTVVGVLPAAGATLFDRRNAVEIELLHDGMWLESRNDDALVAGENLAMIGDELIQFGDAQALGPRRFRLSRLLRGRRGSEWAAATHAAGEAFVLMDADSLLALPMPVAQAGGVVEVAARGMGDGIAPALASRVVGTEAVRPPAPAHLTARRGSDGAIVIAWTRRSRTGWAWIDGVDAPLGEDREAYVVAVSGGTRVRVVEVDAPRFVYSAAMQAEDGAGASVTLDVAVTQAGSAAASRPAALTIPPGEGNGGRGGA